MIAKLKKLLYFQLASYFRFFAKKRLQKWNPRIIVVTGSTGKTTLLHMLEAQMGAAAKYSHHANSSYGIPFDILGLRRKTLQKIEWIWLFLFAPFKLFSALPKEKIYVVEADCDRPGEGMFLAEFLKPEVVLWISTARTHSMNFDSFVGTATEKNKLMFPNVEEAIAYEFGYFLAYCQKLAVVDGDSELIAKQLPRTKAAVKPIKKAELFKNYSVSVNGTSFQIGDKTYTLNGFMPEESFYEIAMCREAVSYFGLPFDDTFKNFHMPPGRGSVFEGIKGTALVDSSYNANLSAMTAILAMFDKFPAEGKWVVLGDMLEQGKEEQQEHEKLAELIAQYSFDRIILMGPRVSKYTHPKLIELGAGVLTTLKFENPKDALNYLSLNIQGGETILFKGARFLEGVIEHLLKNPADAARLARREKVWEKRRKAWGL